MPKCLDCGTETPREEMYGPPDELRCQACAQAKMAPHYAPRREVPVERRPIVTVAITAASVVCTLLYWQSPKRMEWAVDVPQAVWSGELWRYLTTCLLHVNIFHLGFDLYCMWIFSRAIEAWLGPIRFAGLLVLLAAASSSGQLLVFGTAGIGLSGVAFGLFGLLYSLRRYKDFAAVLANAQNVQMIVGWFFLCIVLTYANIMPVANGAHAFGAAAGWLTGQAILSRRKVMLLAAVAAGVLILVAASLYMPWNWEYAAFRGNRFLESGDLRTALYWYERAERDDPGNAALHKFVAGFREAVEQIESEPPTK